MNSNFGNINKQAVENLLKNSASGINAQAVSSAIKSGNIDNILGSLDPEKAQKLKSVLSDKSAIEKILKSPQAAKLMKDLQK